MKTHPIIILSAIVSLFLVSGALAQEGIKPDPGVADEGSDQGGRINAYMADKIIGSRVMNMKGETLGKIDDMVIDIDTGRVLYAVLDFGGFLGIGKKLFPVPWSSLAALPSQGIFFLNRSKEQLANAPGFDKNNLPDMGDRHWGATISRFYRASQEEVREAKEYNFGYPHGYEYFLYPGMARQDPFAKIFDSKSIKKISGEVIKVAYVVPKSDILSQMETELILYTSGKEAVPVYLGPRWYLDNPEGASPYKAGDQVTVTGSWVTSQKTPFMIATSVTQGKETLQLRDDDGTPRWAAKKK